MVALVDVGDDTRQAQGPKGVGEDGGGGLGGDALPLAPRRRRQPISVSGPSRSKGVSRIQPRKDSLVPASRPKIDQ